MQAQGKGSQSPVREVALGAGSCDEARGLIAVRTLHEQSVSLHDQVLTSRDRTSEGLPVRHQPPMTRIVISLALPPEDDR